MDQETKDFIAERENKLGGKMGYRTYCTYYNDTDNNLRDRGVFLFVINNVFYYEDFENQPTFFGLLIRGTNKTRKNKFEKFYSSFSKDDVLEKGLVTKSNANKLIIKKVNKFQKMFNQTIVYVKLKNGKTLFFEAMDKKSFLKELEN